VRSFLQFRAQPQGFADGLAHSPFGPLGPPRCPGRRSGLPRPALLLDLCQHVAAPVIDDLAGNVWVHVHVTHLLSVPLMDGRVRPAAGPAEWDPRLGQDGPVAVRADDHGQVQVTRPDRNDDAASRDGYFSRCPRASPVIATGGRSGRPGSS
jgi:hypothetical protein